MQFVQKVPITAVLKVMEIQHHTNRAEIISFDINVFCYFAEFRELCAPKHLSGVNFDEFVLVDPPKAAEIIVGKSKVAS